MFNDEETKLAYLQMRQQGEWARWAYVRASLNPFAQHSDAVLGKYFSIPVKKD